MATVTGTRRHVEGQSTNNQGKGRIMALSPTELQAFDRWFMEYQRKLRATTDEQMERLKAHFEGKTECEKTGWVSGPSRLSLVVICQAPNKFDLAYVARGEAGYNNKRF